MSEPNSKKSRWLGVLSVVMALILFYLAYAGHGRHDVQLWLGVVFLAGGAFLILTSRASKSSSRQDSSDSHGDR